jgi:hypothetical protein
MRRDASLRRGCVGCVVLVLVGCVVVFLCMVMVLMVSDAARADGPPACAVPVCVIGEPWSSEIKARSWLALVVVR